MSPPETNAISDRSGEIEGSVKYGLDATVFVWLEAAPANAIRQRPTKKALLEVIWFPLPHIIGKLVTKRKILEGRVRLALNLTRWTVEGGPAGLNNALYRSFTAASQTGLSFAIVDSKCFLKIAKLTIGPPMVA